LAGLRGRVPPSRAPRTSPQGLTPRGSVPGFRIDPRPGPVLCALAQARLDGVGLNVRDRLLEVFLVADGVGRVALAEDVALVVASCVVALRVTAVEPMHQTTQVPARALEQEVVMRVHQAVGTDLD